MDQAQKRFSMFLVLLIILNTGYVIFQNNYSTAIIFTTILCFIYLITYEKNATYDYKLLIMTGFIIIILIDIMIYKDFDYSHYLGLIMLIFSSFIVSTSIKLEDFYKYYNQIIFWLSTISIPFFLLGYFFPRIVEGLPTLNYLLNSGETGYKNAIFYLYRYDPRLDFQTGFIKNNSLFWEPGAFQGLLILALIFEIKSQKPNRLRLAVYIISLITTFSTTGFLCGILLLLTVLLVKNNRQKLKINCSTILTTFILVSVILFLNTNLIFGKLSESSASYSSFIERYVGTIQDIIIFDKSNFFGIGYTKFGVQAFGSSNGITSTFAKYGLFFGSIILIGLFSFIKKTTKNIFETLIYTFIFIIILTTEAFLLKSLFVSLMFYGFGFNIPVTKQSKEIRYA